MRERVLVDGRSVGCGRRNFERGFAECRTRMKLIAGSGVKGGDEERCAGFHGKLGRGNGQEGGGKSQGGASGGGQWGW